MSDAGPMTSMAIPRARTSYQEDAEAIAAGGVDRYSPR